VLKALWWPRIEQITDDGRQLLAIRRAFLSRRVADAYGRYTQNQLDRRAAGADRADQPASRRGGFCACSSTPSA